VRTKEGVGSDSGGKKKKGEIGGKILCRGDVVKEKRGNRLPTICLPGKTCHIQGGE